MDRRIRFRVVEGLGFAGALAQVGLPQIVIVIALLALNIGVEIGQLAFAATIVALRAPSGKSSCSNQRSPAVE